MAGDFLQIHMGPGMGLHLMPGQIPFYPEASIFLSGKQGRVISGVPSHPVIPVAFSIFRRCGGHEFGADEVESNTWNHILTL